MSAMVQHQEESKVVELQKEQVAPVTQTEIVVQPLAAPSILGLLGFAGATFIVAANLAGWFGSTQSAVYLVPFAAFFGGLAQFLAGMWSYRARDGLATAMHGIWGSFWMAYGLLNWLIAAGTVKLPTGAFPALGSWFIVLAAFTWVGAIAALAINGALVGTLGTLALGSTLMAIGQLVPSNGVVMAASYVFIVSALVAWYTASGLLFESTFGRSILPLGKTRRSKEQPKINYGIGEPGVIHGQ